MEELKGHPQFVQLEDYFEDETYVYFLMEKIQVCIFEKVMEKKKNERETNKEGFMKFILELLIQFSEALKVMSEKKIYHRDFNCENIMFSFKSKEEYKLLKPKFTNLTSDYDFKVVIIDFGIGKM